MPPQVRCSATEDGLEVFSVDKSIASSDVYAATSGPDVGVQFVDGLVKEEDSSNNNARRKSCDLE